MMPDPPPAAESALLILPDGRLLARNVTPELAALLRALAPDHPGLDQRAASTSAPFSLTPHPIAQP